MKPIAVLILITCATITHALSQHPLIGTWEMLSVKGVDADGNPFFHDTTSVRETKIITPTHYMLIAWDVDGDSLVFNRTMAGKVALDGDKYIEIPTNASVRIFDNVSVDFRWKLDGDIFTQSGTIVRPDGKKVKLEALVFRRVRHVRENPNNPAIGTWQQVSGELITGGERTASLDQSESRMLLVTSSHWMQMDTRNGKFTAAQYGTYTISGSTVTGILQYSTNPFRKGQKFNSSQSVNGNRLELRSDANADTRIHNVYERVRN